MKKFSVAVSLIAIVAVIAWTQRDHIPFLQHLVDQASAETKDGGKSQDSKRHRDGAPTAVKTVAAVRDVLPTDVAATGWATAIDTTTIAAQESGVITSIDAQDGATVKTGDLIARLDPRTAQAAVDKDQATLAKDQANLTQAESALERARTLLNGAGTQQTVDQAQALRDTAVATVDGDKAQLASDEVLLEHTEIRAPYDGRLGDISLSLGAYVSPGTALVTIAKYDPIYVKFHLQESDLRQLQEELAAGPVSVSTVPKSDNGKSRKGEITFFDNQVDPASGTILAKAKFDNANGALWPGRSVNLVVHFADSEKQIVVPTVAVAPGADGFYAYVVGKDKKVHMTPVTVARSNGDRTAVAKGLSEGDHVVVEGQVQLSDGQTVNEQLEDAAGKNLASSAATEETASVGAEQ